MASEERLQTYVDEIMEGETYTSEEVAERLHVSVWSVRSYIRDGLLAAKKQGREYIIPKSSLRDYIVGAIEAPVDFEKMTDPAEGREDFKLPASPKPKAKKPKKKPEGKPVVKPVPQKAEEPEGDDSDLEDVDIEEYEEAETAAAPRLRPTSFGNDGF